MIKGAKINFTEQFIREFQSSIILQSLEIIEKGLMK